MRVIILAAGEGKRLRPYTNDKPKCLVPLYGRTLLSWQLDVLHKNGLHDISIVRGYQPHTLDVSGVKYFDNPEYMETNMVYTLFRAEELFNGQEDLLIIYGDIVYGSDIIEKILHFNETCIAIVSDLSWLKYWKIRMADPLTDAETFRIDKEGNIFELGLKTNEYEHIQGQYIGITLIPASSTLKVLRIWQELLLNKISPPAKKMYMTEFLMELINRGEKLRPIWTHNNWLELDTVEDMNIYDQMIQTGDIKDLINLFY